MLRANPAVIIDGLVQAGRGRMILRAMIYRPINLIALPSDCCSPLNAGRGLSPVRSCKLGPSGSGRQATGPLFPWSYAFSAYQPIGRRRP